MVDGSPPVVLRAAGVEKSYGSVTALDGVDLEVEAGQIVGLLGPNGAGKTTLVSIICGLVVPDAGGVSVDGFDTVRHRVEVCRRIGLAPQELAIYPTLSVRDNLLFLAEIKGMRGSAARRRVGQIAEALGLDALLERRAGKLSGGQQRRLHVGMAFLVRPSLLLLDEPTAGVDVESRAEILSWVRALADDGVAVCYSTHYLQEIDTLDALTVVLSSGRVVARDDPRALARRFGTASVLLRFRDEVPAGLVDGDAALPFPFEVADRTVRISSDEPHRVIRCLVDQLGSEFDRLDALDIERPSLESAFRALVGSPRDGGDDDAPDPSARNVAEVGP